MGAFGIGAALPFLARMAAEGIGADRAATILRGEGFRFTQSVFREYYRGQQLKIIAGPLMAQLPDRIPIPASLFVPTGGRFIQPFRYLFKVQGFDSQTGDRVERFVSIGTDSVISKVEALRALDEAHAVSAEEHYQGIDIESVELDQVQIEAVGEGLF